MFAPCSRCLTGRALPAASRPSSLLTTASACVSRPTQHSRSLNVLYTIDQVRQARLEMESSHTSSDAPFTLGLIPTMGALHDGHMDLVRASQKQNTKTVSPL